MSVSDENVGNIRKNPEIPQYGFGKSEILPIPIRMPQGAVFYGMQPWLP
jgi:hypothetical protein